MREPTQPQESSALSCLVGRSLSKVVAIHDYVQLAFGNQIGLTINNPYRLTPHTSKLDDLIGLKVAAIASGGTQETIAFDNGTTVEIDLRPEAFSSPEAMMLFQEGFPTVVWN